MKRLVEIQGELFDLPPAGPASGRLGPALGAGDALPATSGDVP